MCSDLYMGDIYHVFALDNLMVLTYRNAVMADYRSAYAFNPNDGISTNQSYLNQKINYP